MDVVNFIKAIDKLASEDAVRWCGYDQRKNNDDVLRSS